jgi:hypothetical protein
MTTQEPHCTSQLTAAHLAQSAELVIRLNTVSVSLLQRHFHLGYQDGLRLVQQLEEKGVVTPPSTNGTRSLTEKALATRGAPAPLSTRESFESWAIDPLEGGDGGDPGSPETPSIWLMGIEHGDAAHLPKEPDVSTEGRDYSIDKQLTYQFNQKAFMLLAAINGMPAEQGEQFARLHQPWVPGQKGFFKGNLYPYPAQKLEIWSEGAKRETGFDSKEEYYRWCGEHRLPAIAAAVAHYRPRLFIGVGNTCRQQFGRAYFGGDIRFDEYQFCENEHLRRVFFAKHNGAVFVVIPHLNYYASCLNSTSSIQTAGSFIAGLMK